MAEPIKLNVPLSEIKFELSGNIFTLSLSDKSRARINSEYRKISQMELENNQRVTTLEYDLQQKLSNIKTNLSDADAKKREIAISADYDRKFQQASDQAEKIANEMYLPFVDTLFGDGSGQKVYEICGNNIIAVNKIIAIVMAKMNAENDVTDYMAEYAKSVEKMKRVFEGDTNETDGE